MSPNTYQGYGGQQGYGGGGGGAGGYNQASGYDYSQYNGQQSQYPYQGYPNAEYYGSYGNADAEYQAQMHQWQANYGSSTNGQSKAGGSGNANNLPLKYNRLEGSTPAATSSTTAATTDARKTVVRSGGGQKWEDPTLLEWGNHHRLFIGNLAGEVTDDSLLKAFSNYPSVQKARVIRDKRTTKSKGFGFVSFSDADEYFKAAKEMQNKYIGSHPVQIKRADTEIKVTNKKTEAKAGASKNKAAGGSASGAQKDSVLGPKPGQGIQKKSQKGDTKYKLLG